MPGLAAYYWTGGMPTGYEVLNLGETGAYIRTTATWCPGTILELTVQHHASPDGKSVGSRVVVHAPCRVVRWGPDGMGVRFLFSEPSTREELRKFVEADGNIEEPK